MIALSNSLSNWRHSGKDFRITNIFVCAGSRTSDLGIILHDCVTEGTLLIAMDNIRDQCLYQLEFGCSRIVCDNLNCKSNPKFVTLTERDELERRAAELCAHEDTSSILCPTLPYLVRNPHDTVTLDNFNDIVVHSSSTWTNDQRDVVKKVLSNYELFSIVLLNNKIPLSTANSAISDDLMFEFTGLIAKDEVFSNAINHHLMKLCRSCLESLTVPTYESVRGMFILFYFPHIFLPHIMDHVLKPLLKALGQIPMEYMKVYISWFSKLPNLMKTVVGAVHFAVSHIFSACSHTDPHSDEVVEIIRALSLIVKSNNQAEKRLPPEIFYNHHIDNRINPQKEYERSIFQQSFSFTSLPFVLSLGTKADIVQLESQQMMMTMAMRSFIMSPTPFVNRNDLFFTLTVRRDHLIEDAIAQITNQDPINFLKKLQVIFEGEVAQDSGGPSREFLQLISEKIFSPNFGMFEIAEKQYLWFSKDFIDDAQKFFLVGAIVGLAIHNSIILPVRFPILLYKKLLGHELSIADLNEIDSNLAESLQHVSAMVQEGKEINDLCLSFEVSYNKLGEVKTVPLSAEMEGKDVTNENFSQYLSLYLDWCLVESIKEQYDSFRRGFETTCRAPSYQLFSPAELGTLVSGEEVLDWSALESNVRYADGYTKESKAVKWFWEIFRAMTNEEKIQFLKFSTGMTRAPIGGLGSVNLIIQKLTDVDKLPVSHTCFNIFSLPDYPSFDTMRKNIYTAIEYSEGFGII